MRSLLVSIILLPLISYSQDFKKQYASFRRNTEETYNSFRQECNRKYVEFLRTSWSWYEGKSPIPMPKDDKPIPPQPYVKVDNDSSIVIVPVDHSPIDESPQPIPIEPIREMPLSDEVYISFDFYGIPCRIRIPETVKIKLDDCSAEAIATGWETLCDEGMNNTIRDCLETRIRYNLCDWAYLLFLDELSRQYCNDRNSATLLKAFLYCQSGYQMRLACDYDKLHVLFASRHLIYEMVYYDINGTWFYSSEKMSNSVKMCDFAFENETAMSLWVGDEQKLGRNLTEPREIKSKEYPEMIAISKVPNELIKFYDTYPTSSMDNNGLTRWAIYANTPLSKGTCQIVYPDLKKAIVDCSEEAAANKLLNWVQTGFVYEYDEKIWGRDRAFFAEESLFYPYCDCEDRAILFSRLIRDLLGLDVALVYYPGHMATAVCFNEEVKGDVVMIDKRRFVICDPTYIGAPVGSQMPNLDYDKIQTIILKR